jgi:hypothetical protein
MYVSAASQHEEQEHEQNIDVEQDVPWIVKIQHAIAVLGHGSESQRLKYHVQDWDGICHLL